MTLHKFMDHIDSFINDEDTIWALMAPKKTELEQADQKASGSFREKAPEKKKKTQYDTRWGERDG